MSARKQQVLRLLSGCPQRQRKELLKRLPNSDIKTVCECALNLLHGNIPISTLQKAKLQKYKGLLRTLAKRKTPLYKKRKILIQKGGFLQVLLPAAIGLISSLIGHGIR